MGNDLIGKQVGNYRLVEEIASGGFGTVYRAHHVILTHRIVALKLLHMHMPERERKRFIEEAQLLEQLHHPHILPIIDVGLDNGTPYLISEYASGGSLRDLLNRTPSRLLPWSQALIILTQIGEALHFAHEQNVVHCDLKPDNILFNAAGVVLLADFGIATMLSTMSVKRLTEPEGSPSYMAPEQFHGEVSKKSDQYALGCVAYELATGQRPFTASTLVALGYKHATEPPTPPRQMNSQVTPHVEEAILKALAKQRGDRYSDVISFLSGIQETLFLQKTKKEWLDEGRSLDHSRQHEEAIAAFDRIANSEAFLRFQRAIQSRDVSSIVSAYNPSLDKHMVLEDRILWILSRRFVEAYNANNDGLLLSAYKAIQASVYHDRLIFTWIQHDRVRAAQQRSIYEIPVVPPPIQNSSPERALQPTSSTGEVWIARVKDELIKMETLDYLLNVKLPYIQYRITIQQEERIRLEHSTRPKKLIKDDLKFIKHEIKELQGLLNNPAKLWRMALDDLINDVLLREEIDSLDQEMKHSLNPEFNLNRDFHLFKDFHAYHEPDLPFDNPATLDVLRIFRRRELFAHYLHKKGQYTWKKWIEERRKVMETSILINKDLVKMMAPKKSWLSTLTDFIEGE